MNPTLRSRRSHRQTKLVAVAMAFALVAAACGSSADSKAAPTTLEETLSGSQQTKAHPTPAEPPESKTEPTEEADSTEDSASQETPQPDVEAQVGGYQSVDCLVMTSDVVVEEIFADESIECGYVVVPADWNDPTGEAIQIATYRVPSTSQTPAPDPLVYLEGGPGGSGVLTVGEFANGDASGFRERGDVIVIDQRGTGYSVPALFCPETGGDDNSITGHQACRDRLVAEGIDVADYNTAFNALDVDAVRTALGFDEWNLYGLSYGTRVALTSMRDTPDGLRSVILDSVFPVEVNGLSEAPYVHYAAIDQIAANCVADVDCTIDAKAMIEAGFARLERVPVGSFDGTVYLEGLGEFMTDPDLLTMITTIANGAEADVFELVGELENREDEDGELPPINEVPPVYYPLVGDATAMAYGVVCAEEFAFLEVTGGPSLGDSFGEATRRVVEAAPGPFPVDPCEVWDVPTANQIETQAVKSNIATLVLAGTADMATPSGWSKQTADTLENSTYIEFPGLTHGLLGNNECLNGLTIDFLNDPTAAVDLACVAAFPAVDYSAP